MISPQQRLQYLEAMGIQVWLERGANNESSTCEEKPVELGSLNLDDLSEVVAGCQRCALSQTRQQTVFPCGPVQATWFVVGDMPTAQEEASASLFLEKEGSLLNDMLLAIGESRQSTYLTTSVKCRASGRPATAEENQHCSGYLLRQIELIQPSIVLAMGEHAAQSILSSKSSLSTLRGQVHRLAHINALVIATHHPRDLLIATSLKKEAWHDLQLAKKQLQQ